jgi:hypothetical protein
MKETKEIKQVMKQAIAMNGIESKIEQTNQHGY